LALMSVSFIVIGIFILLVIGVVAGIYQLRLVLQTKPGVGVAASFIASILNAIQITVLNLVYQSLAKVLTDLENHRTDTNYEDSMITKLFMFQFVNSYASFFYIAFVAAYLQPLPGTDPTWIGQCGANSCMFPLMFNLAIIFGSRLIFTNALELIMPVIFISQKRDAETKDVPLEKIEAMTIAEKEYLLLPYDEMMDSIQNYADTAIQFGFMTLFVVALPIATFFSMANGYVKVKMTSFKLVKFYQRPVPQGVQDIGSWQAIFTLLSVMSVITNAALICFTMTVLDSNLVYFEYVGKLWIFLGFQWTIFVIQNVILYTTSDRSDTVEIQLQRTEFLMNRLINKVPDEDSGEELSTSVRESESGADAADVSFVDKFLNFFVPEGEELPTSAKYKKGKSMPQLPVSEYPTTMISGKWPDLLTKDSIKDASQHHVSAADLPPPPPPPSGRGWP